MIKVVQPGGKPLSGVVTSAVTGQPVKIFKSPGNQEPVQVRNLSNHFFFN